jgi:hypothetical protein
MVLSVPFECGWLERVVLASNGGQRRAYAAQLPIISQPPAATRNHLAKTATNRKDRSLL